MRVRESGMPAEGYWESLFDVELVLRRLGINPTMGDVAELGCGYGTFTVPVARTISGTVYTFDIDPSMIERTQERSQGLRVVCQLRDVMAEGFGVTDVDAVLLFNILHCDNPVSLLDRAGEALRPGGQVLVVHWRQGQTPRGPRKEIRPRPEQIAEWAVQTGKLKVEGPAIDLPPWHFGMRLGVVRPTATGPSWAAA